MVHVNAAALKPLFLAATLAVTASCGDDTTQPPDIVIPTCFPRWASDGASGFFASNGPIRAIDAVPMDDGWLCVVADQDALHTFSVSAAGVLTKLGSLTDARNANAVAVTADRAYVFVASRGMGFQVVSLANLDTPTLVPTPPDAAQVFDLDLVGDTIYVAALATGLIAFDVSDPTQPVRLFEVDTPGTAREVAFAEDRYAVVADEDEGIAVIDVTLDPPAIVSTIDTPTGQNATDVHTIGTGHVLASALDDGVLVLSLSDGDPRIVGTVDIPGNPAGISSHLTTAYVAADHGDLAVIDVSDPAAPTQVAWTGIEGDAFSSHVSGAMVFVSGSDGATVVNRTSDIPVWPVFEEGNLTLDVDLHDVLAINSGRIFVASETGITSVDVSVTPPVEQGNFASETNRRLASRPPYVYAANETGVLVTRVSLDESFLAQTAFLVTSGTAIDIVLADTLGFVADGGAGVQILDIRESSSPWIRFTVNTPGGGLGVDYAPAGYCVVADGTAGLAVIDIHSVPQIVGQTALGGFTRDVAVRWPIAYAANSGSQGLSVVDLSDPANPDPIAVVDAPSTIRVELFRNFLLVFTEDEGVSVFDITTPRDPQLVGRIHTLDHMLGLAAAGPDVYVFDESGAIQSWPDACK